MTRVTGLTSSELHAALAELKELLSEATVRDVARLSDRDDLLLFLDTPQDSLALHIVPGGPRARITCTQRRFGKKSFQTGPLVDRLAQTLRGARITALHTTAGERLCSFTLQTEDLEWQLHVELFGARGLWCLADATGRIQDLSRLPNSKGRDLRPGSPYQQPAQRSAAAADPPCRFEAPVLQSIDLFYTAHDRDEERLGLHRQLAQALSRARQKLEHKIAGLAKQQTEAGRVEHIRQQADLLLAYGFGADPGADFMTVPDPLDPDAELTLPLIPGQPIQQQAEKLYQRARKLQDGQVIGQQRQQQAIEELADVEQLMAQVSDEAKPEDLEVLVEECITRGWIRQAKRRAPPVQSSRARQLAKITKGHNVRCFQSEEGLLIMVGRTNQQNDRLSLSIARGNDYWLHVGRGYAGSHVVVRLPKDKTPSLETLLDAGTLAVYFSKARNAHRCEVIYTLSKNVRKPKGLPPGRVVPTDTKTLQIEMDPQRIRRVLDSSESTD
jgi:predicted ribosome quality control (RQC) complex YloA/Tae2 family protein